VYLLAFSTTVVIVGLLYGIFVAQQRILRNNEFETPPPVIPMLAHARPAQQRRRWRFRAQRRKASGHTLLPEQPTKQKTRRRLIIGIAILLAAGLIAAALFAVRSGGVFAAGSEESAIEFAIQVPLAGEGELFGRPALEGIQLAIEEANADGSGPEFTYTIYDNQSSNELAVELAQQIVSSNAIAVLGPVFSTTSLATGPIYATAGMVSLPPSATSDLITQNPTTFRVIFKNSDQGEMLAHYLVQVLGAERAVVIAIDDAYGNTLREGFERTARQIGLRTDYFSFGSIAEAEAIANQVATDPRQRPVALLTLGPEGARILQILREGGLRGPFLGGDTFGDKSFGELLAQEQAGRSRPGFYTANLYGLAPIILDSGSADVLAFAEHYRARFGHEPNWVAIAAYDAAILAIAAVRSTVDDPIASGDLPAQRAAITDFLLSLDAPDKALPGLLGPIWFDDSRARPQAIEAIRIGRFHDDRFESAPIQIVPAPVSTGDALDSGTVFRLSENRFAQLQRVVRTGVFINEISRIDLPNSSFSADFYLWMQFAPAGEGDPVDPTDLIFPNMIDGIFERDQPVRQRTLPDGTEYRLWRVQGEFRNEFDLQMFPFDQQQLAISFFNAQADTSRLVYVVDAQSGSPTSNTATAEAPVGLGMVAGARPAPQAERLAIASPQAFQSLDEWRVLGATSRRENLVTDSALGDPLINQFETRLELSGFLITVDLDRQSLSTLLKTALPLLLMTLIIFASLFFPSSLVKEKVTVAITAALAGAILLSSINGQLGAVGYTLTIEYAFYIFFALALLSITTVLSAEHLRSVDNHGTAGVVEAGTRLTFALVMISAIAIALLML
jgi:branched-chain amino acid transport system substrate-binding protein